MNEPNVIFVCWGNICRSPMAERVAIKKAAAANIHGVRFSSAGVSSEEQGNGIDHRAQKVLRENGYTFQGHAAHKITAPEIAAATLIIGMEDIHLERIRRINPAAKNLYLLTDFDPNATPGQPVPDPWYGAASGFILTLRSIEAAMPEILERVTELT